LKTLTGSQPFSDTRPTLVCTLLLIRQFSWENPPTFDITKLKEKALFVTLGMGLGLRSGSEHFGEEDV
jgi:hypothetical protein